MSSSIACFVGFLRCFFLSFNSHHILAPDMCKRVALRSSDTSGSRSGTPASATPTRAATPANSNGVRASQPSASSTSNKATKNALSPLPSTKSASKPTKSIVANAENLSGYEIEREKNIARNKELLAALDLANHTKPPPKPKQRQPRKKPKPIPKAQRRRGHSTANPQMYVHFA
jgi:hypothetical protein